MRLDMKAAYVFGVPGSARHQFLPKLIFENMVIAPQTEHLLELLGELLNLRATK